MWVLIFVLSVVLGVGLAILSESYLGSKWNELLGLLFLSMIGAFMLSVIGIAWTGLNVAGGSIIIEKIELYQTENKNIEHEIDQVVKGYMEYETETFKNSKAESSITLVSLYPELKADELVKKQVEVYLENKDTITKLKEKKIGLKVSRWWLYFGK